MPSHLDQEPSDIDKAYFAGLVDGEGCLTISARRKKQYSISYESILVVSQNSRVVLDEMQRLFGGWVCVTKRNKDGGPHAHTLRLSGQNLFRILPWLAQFSRMKKDQVRVLQEFQNTFTSRKGFGSRLAENTLEHRERLHLQIKTLHSTQGDWDKSKWDKGKRATGPKSEAKPESVSATIELLGTHHATDTIATEQTNDTFQVMSANTAL